MERRIRRLEAIFAEARAKREAEAERPIRRRKGRTGAALLLLREAIRILEEERS